MKITGVKIEKLLLELTSPFRVAFGTITHSENVMIKVTTDEGVTGYGEAAPLAFVTAETTDSVIAALELFRTGLIGMDPLDIEAVHAMMDGLMGGNSSAKCAVDLNDDIRALTLIRETVGPDVRLRVDANQGYDVPTALKALNAFAALGVESAEQCLPAWNMEGAAYLRRKAPAIHLMLDESIHGPVDAARACRMDAADILNIKLMKCGGLYPAEQINAIAQANGLTCMVGCMMETKLSITAGLSFVAAKKNVMDADLDSFMEYVGGETHFPGGFTHKGSDFVLCDAPGFGLDIDF